MKVLVVSSIFPNSQQATKGIFIQQQVAELAAFCDIKVVAPVPWAPPLKRVRKWHVFSRIKRREKTAGLDVYHPRYLVIPKIGRALYGFCYLAGIYSTVKKILRDFDCDILFAYFAYPDGFAVSLLARMLKRPFVIKVLGSDINIFLRSRIRRFLTVFALRRAQRVIAVSNDLKKKIGQLGISAEKIAVVPNGVDLERFRPREKDRSRTELNLAAERPVILFVGSLIKTKGVEFLFDAFTHMRTMIEPRPVLVFIGEGDLRASLAE